MTSKSSSARTPARRYFVFSWTNQTPWCSSFVDREMAVVYAKARNGLFIEGKIQAAWDWWRRAADGEPMPVEVKPYEEQTGYWPPMIRRFPL